MAQSDNEFGKENGKEIGKDNGTGSGGSLTYAQVQELLPGFALGALTVHEMNAVEQYLQQHEQLIHQRYELELASQAIAYTAAPQPLPPSVKSRLMQRVSAESATNPASAPQPARPDNYSKPAEPAPRRSPFIPAPRDASLPANAPRTSRRSGAVPLFPEAQRQRSGWNGWTQGLIGVAALAATGLLLFSNWQLQNSTTTLNQQIAAAQQQVADSQQSLQQKDAELVTLQGKVDAAETQLSTVQATAQEAQRSASELATTNEGLQKTIQQQGAVINRLATANRVLTLAGSGTAAQAKGTFAVNNGSVIIVLSGLNPVAADKTYQLWYIAEGEAPQPADLFQANAGDTTILTFTIPSQVTSFATVGISIEPTGGSPAPTDVVMLSST